MSDGTYFSKLEIVPDQSFKSFILQLDSHHLLGAEFSRICGVPNERHREKRGILARSVVSTFDLMYIL